MRPQLHERPARSWGPWIESELSGVMMSFFPSLRAAWMREGQSKWRGGSTRVVGLQAPLEDEVRAQGQRMHQKSEHPH